MLKDKAKTQVNKNREAVTVSMSIKVEIFEVLERLTTENTSDWNCAAHRARLAASLLTEAILAAEAFCGSDDQDKCGNRLKLFPPPRLAVEAGVPRAWAAYAERKELNEILKQIGERSQ
jgi:hypothetical protein